MLDHDYHMLNEQQFMRVTVYKRNADAFSLNAMVEVRLRRLLHSHEMIFLISRKLLELATSKFTTTQPTIVFTFRPEMTLQSTSGRRHISQMCQF